MPVFKATYTITCMGEFDTPQQAEAAFANADISNVIEAMESGEFIGQTHLARVDRVTRKNLKTELLAIGNDGDFFSIHP